MATSPKKTNSAPGVKAGATPALDSEIAHRLIDPFETLYMGVIRTTYLVSAQGLVTHAWPNVKVPGHAQAVLQALANPTTATNPTTTNTNPAKPKPKQQPKPKPATSTKPTKAPKPRTTTKPAAKKPTRAKPTRRR